MARRIRSTQFEKHHSVNSPNYCFNLFSLEIFKIFAKHTVILETFLRETLLPLLFKETPIENLKQY